LAERNFPAAVGVVRPPRHDPNDGRTKLGGMRPEDPLRAIDERVRRRREARCWTGGEGHAVNKSRGAVDLS